MSNQHSIIYKDKDIVWVKLGRGLWWPGEVCGESNLPDGLLSSLKAKPLFVVRFFDENKFEYVKKLANICKYNDPKKINFIKKGLESYRAKHKHSEKFPIDVQTAETLTNGDPDIINQDEFQPQSKKSCWADIFKENKTQKLVQAKKNTNPKRGKQSVQNMFSTSTPYRKSIDHEIRILTQPVIPSYSNSVTPEQIYKCHLCNFSSKRVNVVMLHSKTHSNQETLKPVTPCSTPLTTNIKEKIVQKQVFDITATSFQSDDDSSSDDNDAVCIVRKDIVIPKKRGRVIKQNVLNTIKPGKPPIRRKRRVSVEETETTNENGDSKENDWKKTKTENKVELKSEILADWMEDDSATDFKPFAISKESVSDEKFEFIDVEDVVILEITEPLTKEKHETSLSKIVKDSPSSGPVTKYRNIPKKDRERDFVFENLPSNSLPVNDKSIEVDINTVKNTETVQPQMSPVSEIPHNLDTNKIDIINVIEVCPVGEDNANSVIELTTKPHVIEMENENHELITENNVTVFVEAAKEVSETRISCLQETTDILTVMQQTEIDENISLNSGNLSGESDNTNKSVDINDFPPKLLSPVINRILPKASEISCFDFQEEDDVDATKSPPRRQRKRKSLHLSSENNSNDEEEKIKRDILLKKEADALLKTATVPKLPDLPNTSRFPIHNEQTVIIDKNNLVESLDNSNRTLPPKERGKRIFKSRNRNKISIENQINLIKKDIIEKASDNNIEEKNNKNTKVSENTETLLVASKSIEISSSHSYETNELLSNFEATAEVISNTKTEELINERNSSSNGESNPIHISRKKHLQAAFKAEEEKSQTADNNFSDKHTAPTSPEITHEKTNATFPDSITNLNISPLLISTPSLSPKQKFVLKLKEESFISITPTIQNKFEPRTPKKRKTTLEEQIMIADKHAIVIEPLSLTAIKPKSPIEPIDDTVFDINNMQIVLSNEDLPEPIEELSIINVQSPPKIITFTSTDMPVAEKIIEPTTTLEIEIGSTEILNKSNTLKLKSSDIKKLSSLKRKKRHIGKKSPIIELPLLREPSQTLKSTKLSNRVVGDSSVTITDPEIISNTEIILNQLEASNSDLDNTDEIESQIQINTIKKKSKHRKIICLSPSRKSKLSNISTETITTQSNNESVLIKGKQIIQATSGGQIVITSKGQLLTTNSQTITSSKVSTQTSDTSTSSKPIITASQIGNKKSHKIQVQSQKIIYPKKENSNKSLIRINKPKSVDKSNTTTDSPNKVKMSLHSITEMTKLGYIKEKGKERVLTTTGLKKIQQQLLQNSIERIPPLSPIDEAKTSNDSKNTAEGLEVIESENTIVESSPSTIELSVESENTGPPESVVATNLASATVVAAAEITENYYACAAETFGGPPNSFYLCRSGENNTFVPIDNRALYLDANNRLVEEVPEINIVNTTIETNTENLSLNASDDITEISQIQEQSPSYIINTGDGQHIILDQQSLLSLAAGEMPHLITADGQQIILQGTPQDIITAIAVNQQEMGIITGEQQIIIPHVLDDGHSGNNDLLAVALEGTDVYQSVSIIEEVSQNVSQPEILSSHTVPTATVHSNPPIMSASEVPTKKNSDAPTTLTLESGLNIDDSLAVIGVTTMNSNVPTSLELPITVTNPAIASKTSPLSINTIYTPSISSIGTTIRTINHISPSLDYDLFDIDSTSNSKVNVMLTRTNHLDSQYRSCTPENISNNDDDNVIPQSPEASNNDIDDGRKSTTNFSDEIHSDNSNEIPIQPNLVIHSSNYLNESLINENNGDGDLTEINMINENNSKTNNEKVENHSGDNGVDEGVDKR